MEKLTNMQLLARGGKNQKRFAAVVASLACSQGFYGRIIRDVNEMEEDDFNKLCALIDEQDWHDPLDVVLWLEA